MKDRYFISITTIHGTKHYSVRQIIKYVLVGFLALIAVTLVVGYLYIEFLNSKTRQLEEEKKNLHKKIKELNLQLLAKKGELDSLSLKIDDLEEKLQLKYETFAQGAKIEDLGEDEKKILLDLIPSGSPVKKIVVSCNFGWRKHPISKKREFHAGIDLCDKGDVPIYATASGIVVQARKSKYGYGNVVRLAHIYGFTTLYAHLREISVKKGDFIKKGDIIGYMGSSGFSTGQHLHYEVRYDSKPLEPRNFMKWNSQNFYSIFEKERRVPWESLVKAVMVIPSLKRPQLSPSKQESLESSSSTQTSTSTEKWTAKSSVPSLSPSEKAESSQERSKPKK